MKITMILAEVGISICKAVVSVVALLVILSILAILVLPGWIAAAIKGWSSFVPAVGGFWICVFIVGFVLFMLWPDND